jgi:hypothetical protein
MKYSTKMALRSMETKRKKKLRTLKLRRERDTKFQNTWNDPLENEDVDDIILSEILKRRSYHVQQYIELLEKVKEAFLKIRNFTIYPIEEFPEEDVLALEEAYYLACQLASVENKSSSYGACDNNGWPWYLLVKVNVLTIDIHWSDFELLSKISRPWIEKIEDIMNEYEYYQGLYEHHHRHDC